MFLNPYRFTSPPILYPGLRITYNDIQNSPIPANDANLEAWNAALGTTYTGIAADGNAVVLWGAMNQTLSGDVLKGGDTLEANNRLLSVVDEIGSVTSIGNAIFFANDALTTLDFPAATALGDVCISNTNLWSGAVLSVNFPLVNSIGTGCFESAKGIVSVSMPRVTSLPIDAFNNTPRLTTLDLPELTSLGEGSLAFTALSEINFPSVTTVGSGAISGGQLQTISLPAATAFGFSAISQCASLTMIDIPSVTMLGKTYASYLFQQCNLPNLTIRIPAAMDADDDIIYARAQGATIVLVLEG